MTAARVLVVDDEPGLVRALAINLRSSGWDVATAPDGAHALNLAATWHPDVVLLDLGLPDIAGLDVIAGIRGWSRVPIVVLSARQHGEDKVDALDAGADDYVTKPFAMNELLARLRAAVRRATPGDATEAVVEAGDLTIDLARRRVYRHGDEVRLSPTEWALVDILVKVDRATMAVSLESRAPFMHPDIVEFAWRIPPSQQVRDGQGKWLLRQVLYKYVPRELIERPKMGFGVPIASWLRGPLREWAEALIAADRLEREGYLAPAPIRAAWNEHQSGASDNSHLLWGVLMFQAWLEAQ